MDRVTPPGPGHGTHVHVAANSGYLAVHPGLLSCGGLNPFHLGGVQVALPLQLANTGSSAPPSPLREINSAHVCGDRSTPMSCPPLPYTVIWPAPSRSTTSRHFSPQASDYRSPAAYMSRSKTRLRDGAPGPGLDERLTQTEPFLPRCS